MCKRIFIKSLQHNKSKVNFWNMNCVFYVYLVKISKFDHSISDLTGRIECSGLRCLWNRSFYLFS